MPWFYIIIILLIFIPIPILFYGVKRNKIGTGEILGGLLFLTYEILWYSLVQSEDAVSYDLNKVLPYQLLNLFPGDYLLIALVYLNGVSIHRWMTGR